ncbi:unnamed protein product [Zymoseptoria tritici ST99CH_3D1]|nr:unnamed protein product [Zymoseptoria tritici ST99CH_3D1]
MPTGFEPTALSIWLHLQDDEVNTYAILQCMELMREKQASGSLFSEIEVTMLLSSTRRVVSMLGQCPPLDFRVHSTIIPFMVLFRLVELLVRTPSCLRHSFADEVINTMLEVAKPSHLATELVRLLEYPLWTSPTLQRSKLLVGDWPSVKYLGGSYIFVVKQRNTKIFAIASEAKVSVSSNAVGARLVTVDQGRRPAEVDQLLQRVKIQ